MPEDDDTPDTPEEVVEKVYPEPAPLLSDGQPLMLPGLDIERIVILPKDYKTEHPAIAAMESESAALRKQVSELSEKNKELVSQIASEKETHAALSKKLDEIQDTERVDLATEIANLRMEKGFLKEEDKEASIKSLSALDPAQLKTQLEDTRSLSASPDDEPETVVTEDDETMNLSEKELNKNALRKELGFPERETTEVVS